VTPPAFELRQLSAQLSFEQLLTQARRAEHAVFPWHAIPIASHAPPVDDSSDWQPKHVIGTVPPVSPPLLIAPVSVGVFASAPASFPNNVFGGVLELHPERATRSTRHHPEALVVIP
jgi:hypothetical protein